MTHFLAKYHIKNFIFIFLMTFVSFTSNVFAQYGEGTNYCAPEGSVITLTPDNSLNDFPGWEITLENFCIESSKCPDSQGMFTFTIKSTIECDIIVDVDDVFSNTALSLPSTTIQNVDEDGVIVSNDYNTTEISFLEWLLLPSTSNEGVLIRHGKSI